jgi:outer membrane protein
MRYANKTVWFSLAAMLACGVAPYPSSAQEEEESEPSPFTSTQALESETNVILGAPIDRDIPTLSEGPSITLSQALKLANERNVSLAVIRTDIEKAQADFRMTWATLVPMVNGSLAYTHADHEDVADTGSVRIVTRRQDNLSGNINADMPIVDTQSWFGVRSGRLGVKATRLTVENARQQLLFSVSEAFYQALTATALIEVQESLWNAAVRHHEVALTRHLSGVGTRLDVIRARSDLTRVRQELVGAHRVLDNTRDALGILTGIGGLPLPKAKLKKHGPVKSAKELVSQSKKDRVDIKASKAVARLSENELDTTWMQFVPTLDASWQLTHRFTAPSAFGSQDRTRWNAMVTLTVPFYNQMRYADLDKKRASLKKSQLQIEETELNAGLEVRTARRDYITSQKQLKSAREQAVLSYEALRLTEEAYKTGTGSSLDVTDASRSSRQDTVELAIQSFEHQIALLRLLLAVGKDMATVGD